MNDNQVIRLVIKGLCADGFKIYGDKFIGFRAFKEDDGFVEEFNFNKVYQYEGAESDFVCDFLNSECESVKSGEYSDCVYWDSSKISY